MNELEGYNPNFEYTDLDSYQTLATGTAIYPGQGWPTGLIYTALKMNGEAGEFAEHVGKAMRDDDFGNRDLTKEREELLVKELGDVLWYISAAADELGYPLSVIANTNLKKLYNRKQRGVLNGSGDTR